MDRRAFVDGAMRGLIGLALVRLFAFPRALAGPAAGAFDAWLERLHGECRDLSRHALTPAEWQTRVESLLEHVDLRDLLRAIDFERVRDGLEYPDLGVATARASLPGVDGLPDRLAFYPKIFGMGPGRAVIPHGHRNMASAHLVIDGRVHLRQYERVADEDGALIVEPLIDRTIGPGHASSISDEARNVHWLVAEGGHAHTLDVIVTGIDPDRPSYEIDNLDPDRSERVGAGRWRMPKLSVDEGLARYGKSHHERVRSGS